MINNQNLIINKGIGKYIWTEKKQKVLDFSLSNGANILGHSNSILKKFLKKNFSLGTNFSINNKFQNLYTNEIKKTFRKFNTIQFCNSGSEANLRALRVARSITNKEKFAMLSGSWHGSIDSCMFDLKKNKTIPLSSGISGFAKQVILLPTGQIHKSIKILKKNKNKISAILIEPIQSSNPDKNSIIYLKAIYKIAKKYKILIIFDEVITGLRVKNLTFFRKYRFQPDIVTFGKCFGGGFPIGIVLISKKIEKKIITNNHKIFMGGTFSGNPISTGAGYFTFKYLKKKNVLISNKINFLANIIKTKLNKFSKINKKKFKILEYETILKPTFYEDKKLTIINQNIKPKLQSFLLKNNIYLPNNGCIFLSPVHSIKDVIYLSKKIEEFLLNSDYNI